MDFRWKTPGKFLKSQEIAAILLNIKDMNGAEIAKAFVKIGLKSQLTQKQRERIFRSCRNDYGKSSLELIEAALRTVIWDEETDRIEATIEENVDTRTFETIIDDLRIVNTETNTDDVKSLRRNAFFILNEFFIPLLNEDEYKTFRKLMDSIEGRS